MTASSYSDCTIPAGSMHMRHNAPRIAVQDVLRFGAAGIMIVADRVGTRLTSEAE